jgi:ribosomal protein S3AE
MAKKTIKSKSRISVKKKRWYQVQAPKVLNSVVFGETLAADPEMLKDRGFNVNLGSVVRGGRNTNISVKFKVSNLKANICETDFYAYELSNGYVKRLVRRAKRRVDDSFVVESKDGIKFRIKPLVLIKNPVQASVQTTMRLRLREFVAKLAQENEYNKIVSMILQGNLQKEFKTELKKVHPFVNAEVRALQRV